MFSLDSDLGRHLTLGQYILESRSVPARDLLSHTLSGEPRPPYEWLAQVSFALLYRLAGLDGVILLCALIIALAFSLVYQFAARRSGIPLTALLIAILAASAASLHWLPRPHIFTFLFFALWLERLEAIRRAEHVPRWQIPLLMLLWANTHGGFIFGFLAWAAYLAGWLWERWRGSETSATTGRPMLLAGLLALPASIITPDGWGNWEALLGNRSRFILSQTVETMSPDFYQPGTWPFLILLTLGLILPGLSSRRPPAAHVFLLAGFGLLGLYMARDIPLFAIAATPILAESARHALGFLARWITVEENISRLEAGLHGWVWPALTLVAATTLLTLNFLRTGVSLNQFDARVFPVQAADWLAEHPQEGRMFNEFNWGGYLLYRLWPEQRVFLDSQTDFYGEALVRKYNQVITAGEGWESILIQYDVNWVIVRADSALAHALRADGTWRIVYQDPLAVIFSR